MGYFTTMAGAQELSLGLTAQNNLQDEGDQQVIGGLIYRMGDAIIPMIEVRLQEYQANLYIRYHHIGA